MKTFLSHIKKEKNEKKMNKLIFGALLFFLFNVNTYANDVRSFQIEGISIGDSALDYFSDVQLEDNELDWHNYTHKEYSTSLLPGKGIYDHFQVSYVSDDDNFTIEGIVGIIVKKNYNDKECSKKLDSTALNISKLFTNIKQGEKKSYKIIYDPRKTYLIADSSGKSILTSILLTFMDNGEIILACYDMDKETNEIDSFIKNINQFDSFRVDVRSSVFSYYLKNLNKIQQ